jgi:hypothetical protein
LREAGAGVQWLCWVGEWRVQLGGQVSALEGSKLLLLKVTQLLGCTRHATSAIAIQPCFHTRTFF